MILNRPLQDRSESGLALPSALVMMLMTTVLTLMLSKMSVHSLTEVSMTDAADTTYLAAEGALNKQIGEMSVFGNLWEAKPALATLPSGYTEYSPLSFIASNGIPTCTGIACHRDLYPTGGGLLKNVGPVGDDGDVVDATYSITEQIDPNDLPTADLTVSSLSAWSQVERLDESTPSSATVGGSLSNSVAEGGNSKVVRYRITGVSTKNLRGRRGYATVVAVVEMPLS